MIKFPIDPAAWIILSVFFLGALIVMTRRNPTK